MRSRAYCSRIADTAVAALEAELETTPKPGLVDKNNNGAHRDMDYEMFRRSAAVLRDCFERCALEGMLRSGADTVLTERLRGIGAVGEQRMLEATGGVNTHRGAIFSLGIMCAACGMTGTEVMNAKDLRDVSAKIARVLLGQHAGTQPRLHAPAVRTHGIEVFEQTGLGGIRVEACSGFATAFDVGLCRLRSALDEGHSMNSAMIGALLAIMSKNDDSNIVYRGGLQGLDYIKRRSTEILDLHVKFETSEALEAVERFDDECIARNLSPGGSADLLALSVMLHYLLPR